MRTYKTHRTIQDPKSGDYKSLCGILSDLADKPLTRKNDKVNCKRCIRKMDNMREHGKQFQPERTVQQDMFDEALPPEAKPLPRTNDNVEWVEFVDSNVIYEFNGLDGWAVQPVKPTGKLRRSGEMSGQVMLAGQGCYRTASSEAITEYIALNNPGTSVRFDLELYLAKHRSIARDCGEQSWVAQPTQAEIAKAEIAKTMYDSRNQDAEAKEFIERKILGLCKSDLDYWNDAFDKLSEEKIATGLDYSDGRGESDMDPLLISDEVRKATIKDLEADDEEYLRVQQEPWVDLVNHPPHYTSDPSGVECIQVTEHRNFCIGNAIKYLWRNGLKDGESNEKDLKKAIWYIERELEREIKRVANEGESE